MFCYCVCSVFETSTEEEGIQLANFLNVVGQLKFRGTSVLFRLPHSPVVKVAKTRSQVRELSPVPGATPGLAEPNEERAQKVTAKAEKRVSFVGLKKQIGEREEKNGGGGGGGEDEMEVGRRREDGDLERGGSVGGVTGTGEERVDGEGGESDKMSVDPDTTLLYNLPVVKLRNELGRETHSAFSMMEGGEFSIATHFVKASFNHYSRAHTHTHTHTTAAFSIYLHAHKCLICFRSIYAIDHAPTSVSGATCKHTSVYTMY